jgi:hypothetical protein
LAFAEREIQPLLHFPRRRELVFALRFCEKGMDGEDVIEGERGVVPRVLWVAAAAH